MRRKNGGIFQVCVEDQGLYKIEAPPENEHTTAQLINHTRKHGVYISIKIGIQKEELAK